MSQPVDQLMSSDSGGGGGGGEAISISNEVMIAAVAFLFMVVVFVFFLYLYAKRFLGADSSALRRHSRARFVFADAHGPGLDAAVLQSLPVTVFRRTESKEGLECAVCLSELSEGEEVRLLPKCSHGFHLECIDMWFHSHSTCPLCRSSVGPHPPSDSSDVVVEIPPPVQVSEDRHLPTNVLFWGTHTGGLAGSGSAEGAPAGCSSAAGKREGMLVVEIPRRVVDGFPSSPMMSSPQLPSSRFPSSVEEVKTPTSSRMRSLRRLLSRGKRMSSPSPRGGGGGEDIEQGLMGGGAGGGGGGGGEEGSTLPPPKTPTYS